MSDVRGEVRGDEDPERARLRVLGLLKRHGWNATSFQVLEPAFRFWFDGDDACVAYAAHGGAWVAAGPPIAAEGDLVRSADAFVAAARRAGRRPCFAAVERRFVGATGFGAVAIGEQPVWDPRAWTARLATSRALREQLRRARAKGVVVRPVDPRDISDVAGPTRRAIGALVDRWLASRRLPPLGFLVDLHPFSFPAERRYFVAEIARARADSTPSLVGFLAAVPVYARGGWFFEDLLRDPAAPNGVSEALVHHAMLAVAAEGSAYVTLGLAPLAGDVPPWLRAVRSAATPFYDFDGLRAFKAKLHPERWEPIYVAYPRGARGVVAIADTLVAMSHGAPARFVAAGVLARLRRAAERRGAALRDSAPSGRSSAHPR